MAFFSRVQTVTHGCHVGIQEYDKGESSSPWIMAASPTCDLQRIYNL
jgi:hypothetical protein